jgi:adenylylsulfate kinase
MLNNKVIWIFGKSGAGKSTLGFRLARDLGYLFLDADVVRKFLQIRPDFTKKGRENFQEALRHHMKEIYWRGNSMVVASITPFQEMRNWNRLVWKGYTEVFISCADEVLIKRDPKGLYAMAQRGEIDNMFMFEDPYEERFGTNSIPEVTVRTDLFNEEECYKYLKLSIDRILEGR